MEAEAALELVKQGATLLLLDVPQNTLIGIDTQMFSSGPNFKGVKMIPPGVHFIYYSSSSREGNEFAPIVGFFIDASPSEVIVKKWDPKEERFVKLAEEECWILQKYTTFGESDTHPPTLLKNPGNIANKEERYAQSVKKLEFDRQLGPYALDQYGDWKRLSNFITKSTIERIEPIGGDITIMSESEMVENVHKTAMEKVLAEQLKSSKFSKPDKKLPSKGCYYTSIPRVIKLKGASGQDLTNMNLDKTQMLETILTKQYGGSEDSLLGELQFAFVAFLMGQSLEAFLQWKLLVSLLLGCTEAPLQTRTQLFTKFIRAIYYQLKIGFQKDSKDTRKAEKGATASLDESLLSADNFLRHLCKDFFSLVLDAPVVDGDLLTWTRKLRTLLEQTLGWDFQMNSAVDGMHLEEDDEVVPVASMLTPNQFEAEQLTGSSISSEKDGQEACNILHAAGPSKVVITSINIDGTLLLIGSHQKEKGQSPEQFKIVIPKIPAYFTGTGDLMTALLLGWSNKYPNDLDKAAELAVSSVQALLLRTLADYQKCGYDCQSSSLEIRLIQSLDDIRKPEVKYRAKRYN